MRLYGPYVKYQRNGTAISVRKLAAGHGSSAAALDLVSLQLYSGAMSKNETNAGRPTHVAPTGWVTLKDAAAQRGVSYSVVYRHVKANEVRWQQLTNGVLLVRVDDLARITKHEAPKDRDRIPVQLAPSAKRHRAWTRAARRIGGCASVTELAYRLLDEAAGFDA